jgi:hypothetical protein
LNRRHQVSAALFEQPRGRFDAPLVERRPQGPLPLELAGTGLALVYVLLYAFFFRGGQLAVKVQGNGLQS